MAYNFKEIKVLIVDSQAAIIQMVRGALRLLGVPATNLFSSTEGGMALNLFNEIKPDLLIVDWEIENLNGIEFIKSIRSSDVNPYVPIIFMTALTTENRVKEARDSGISEFLAKPFTARTISGRIEAIVEKPRPFVVAQEYRGPDRRRRTEDSYSGVEKRGPGRAQEISAADLDIFKSQKKVRSAAILMPPNSMKEKMGSGGVDMKALEAAQNFLDTNTVDFKPMGMAFLKALHEARKNAKVGKTKNETAIEFMLYPAAQLKAQGILFRYPLITQIANILVQFLETVERVDDEVFEIVEAHITAFLYILNNNVTDNGGEQEKKLQTELLDACGRYYKSRNLL